MPWPMPRLVRRSLSEFCKPVDEAVKKRVITILYKNLSVVL